MSSPSTKRWRGKKGKEERRVIPARFTSRGQNERERSRSIVIVCHAPVHVRKGKKKGRHLDRGHTSIHDDALDQRGHKVESRGTQLARKTTESAAVGEEGKKKKGGGGRVDSCGPFPT